MSKLLKAVSQTFKRKIWTSEEDSRRPLVSNMTSQLTEHVEGDSRTQTSLNSSDQSGETPSEHHQDSEADGQRVLSILRDVLLGDLGPQELEDAAEMVKQWTKLNSTNEGKDVNFSQTWLKEYLSAVETSVHKHFPALPEEEPKDSHLQTKEYKKLAGNLRSKVILLASILEDSRLLSVLVDSYNHQLFAVLDLLSDRSSTVKDVMFLLQWVKEFYFSHDLKGGSNSHPVFFRVSDPLLVTGWFEKSKQKFLKLMQLQVSTTLQNVLLYCDENCNYYNEEDLIKVHLDVIQCLNAAIQETEIISKTLMIAVQRVCCDELHSFVQRYVNAEKKLLEAQKMNETYSLHLFRIINTCRHLRSYTVKIVDLNNNTDSSTLLMLENMEAQVSTNVQECFSGLAKDHLKKYFKEKNVHIHQLMDMIQKMFAPLPQMEQEEDTKQHMLNVAYKSVTRAYLQCLMQSKCSQLEKKWGDIEERMMKDAKLFHSTFTHLGIGDDTQKKFLLKMGEILGFSNVDSLKLICAELNQIFPEESEKYLPALLKWKKTLSKWQRTEILNASKEPFQNGEHRGHCWMYWSCCLCCT